MKVWVFNPAGKAFPSAVFSSRERAEEWINSLAAQGTLTSYQLDESAYQTHTRAGWFAPKRDDQRTPDFEAAFAGGHEHFHYNLSP